MRFELRSAVLVLLLVVLFVGMWYETFRITGVTTPVLPAHAARPAPPAPLPLAPLPMDMANTELFSRAHPVWSALAS
jgi:hypothetical protein